MVPLLFLLPSHNFTPLCISIVSLAHFDLPRILIFTLFSMHFLSLTFFSFPSFLSVNLHQRVQYVLSISLFPVTAVLQGSARQLTKKIARSMIITSPFYTLPTLLCHLPAFFFITWDCFFSKTYESYAYSRKLCKVNRTNVQTEGGLF